MIERLKKSIEDLRRSHDKPKNARKPIDVSPTKEELKLVDIS